MIATRIERRRELMALSDREERIGALFDHSYPSLKGLAYVMLGDAAAAEEVAQDAFVKAFSFWSRFKDVEHPEAYLRKIVINLCRSRIRRTGIEQRVNAVVHRDAETTVEPPPETSLDLWDAVKRLPERQRAAIVLRYLEDLSEAEVAALLDCSIGTVKSQLFKARRKLGAALEPDGGDR